MFNAMSGRTMNQMLSSKLGASYPQGQGPADLSPSEAARDYRISADLRTKSFMGNIFTRFILPHDTPQSHDARAAEFMRQSAMPWGYTFMATPTDKQRLNNPSQNQFVHQRQLSPPSTYGQFYAFMHAMAAAFGNLNTP